MSFDELARLSLGCTIILHTIRYFIPDQMAGTRLCQIPGYLTNQRVAFIDAQLVT